MTTSERAPSPAPVDRRAALKARHRRAILDAAGALITERGGPRFSVDELAERADVSRRTVFNHFASVDDIVLTACTEVLEVVVDNFLEATITTPVGDGSRAAMFDEIAQVLRATDLAGAIAYLCRALGAMGPEHDPRQKLFVLEAFSRTADHLKIELARRNPTADLLDIDLLVTSLVHGVSVIAAHWVTTTDLVSPAARVAWDGLIDRLIDSVRAGYMPER